MKTKLLLIFIILLAVFMRFYNLPGLFHFTMDEEYWMYIPYNIATGYHFPLIGGNMADTGLYTTPWFVYLMSIISFIGNGNPLIFGIFVSVIGVLTTLLIYYLGKKLFDEKMAFLASFFYAGSTLMALWDRHYWNASFTPILSLLTLYFFIQKKWISLGLTLALAVSAHGTGLSLVIFVLIATLFKFQKKALISGVILGLSFLPLLFFETRHHFEITKGFVKYIGVQKENNNNVLKEFIYASGKIFSYKDNFDVSSQLTLGDITLDRGVQTQFSWLILGIGLVGLIKAKKLSENEKLLILMVISTLLGLMIFKSPLSIYYFSPIVISIFYLIAKGVLNLNTVFIILVILFFLPWNLWQMTKLYHSGSYVQKINSVNEIIKDSKSDDFNVKIECTGHCVPYGFRYLFTYLKKEPNKSFMDPYFMWFYENKIPKTNPKFEYKLLVSDKNIDVQKSLVTDN